jgi:hypothetical protein
VGSWSEAAEQGWTLRDLKRQFNAGLYERLALSRDKKAIHDLAHHGQDVSRPQDILREPYVLEFLGLEGRATYSDPISKRLTYNISYLNLARDSSSRHARSALRLTKSTSSSIWFIESPVNCYVLCRLENWKPNTLRSRPDVDVRQLFRLLR